MLPAYPVPRARPNTGRDPVAVPAGDLLMCQDGITTDVHSRAL
jgi:hypothetical protein